MNKEIQLEGREGRRGEGRGGKEGSREMKRVP
jgi:hypothetical protein